eukprot:g67662.t1
MKAIFHASESRTSHVATPVPVQGIGNVLVKPSVPLQLLPPALLGGPSALFVYNEAIPTELLDGESKVAFLYGAKVPESAQAAVDHHAVITGRAEDVIQGQLLSWPAVRFRDKLAVADQMHLYDPASLPHEVVIRRAAVSVVLLDGSTVRAYWYYKVVSSTEASRLILPASLQDKNCLPAGADLQDMTERTSLEMLRQIQRMDVHTPLTDRPIATAYVRQGKGQGDREVWLLHGFDSSLMEFRRLLPLIAPSYSVLALDLLGFGFTDRTAYPHFSPETIKMHLYSLWKQHGSKPVVLCGASMGGAAAIDFALSYPDAVSHLVLLDSAGFAAAPDISKIMFPPLDRMATSFLASRAVRSSVSRQSYFDPKWANADADKCASLHLACPRWSEGLISFTKSGGYNQAYLQKEKISQVSAPTLILWGRQDKILGTKDAELFKQAISGSRLVWMENCGHVPHLEQPHLTAEAIIDFVRK